MTLKLISLCVCLLAACTMLHDTPTLNVNPALDSNAKIIQDVSTSPAQNSILTNEKFVIAVEFVLYARQKEQYPEIADAFLMALHEWEKHIPIKLSVFTEDPTVINPVYGVEVWHNRPGIIQVLIVDLNAPPFNYPEGVIGLWDSVNHHIQLDADVLTAHPDAAYGVSLHELGHVFGVPHIVGEEDHGISGFIIVPKEVEAEKYVMYPIYKKDGHHALSVIEINLAIHHVMHFLTNRSLLVKSDRCVLTNQ